MFDEEVVELLKIRKAALEELPPVNPEAEARIEELVKSRDSKKIAKLVRTIPSK